MLCQGDAKFAGSRRLKKLKDKQNAATEKYNLEENLIQPAGHDPKHTTRNVQKDNW